MKDILIDKILNWSRDRANQFHDHKFVNAGEDGNYIWEKDDTGIFLWKDINAVHFGMDGKIHKLSIWSFPEYWNHYCHLFREIDNNASCMIEQPLEYEYDKTLGMGYSVVQRPGKSLGHGFIESLMMDAITEDTIMSSIEDMMILFQQLSKINKLYGSPFPFPPKQFENSHGKFWADFKYWKYTEGEFKNNYVSSMERFLPVLSNDYKIPLNTHIILEKLYRTWKI